MLFAATKPYKRINHKDRKEHKENSRSRNAHRSGHPSAAFLILIPTPAWAGIVAAHLGFRPDSQPATRGCRWRRMGQGLRIKRLQLRMPAFDIPNKRWILPPNGIHKGMERGLTSGGGSDPHDSIPFVIAASHGNAGTRGLVRTGR